MAILAFQKPDKVVMLEADNQFGKFEFRPLEPGFGVTIGNALRRILLSSLEGYAVNTIRIAGVEHEFSSVPGVKEDVTNIILNLKQVRFKQVVEEFENEKVSITVENSTEFKAGDIGKYLTGFEVLNPDLVICHLDSKASMQIDLTINKGRGYVPADENRQFCTDVNVLPIDSIYTPIRNVKYAVEPYRVEQKTDYDKLVLEVTTDGSISPKDALKEAAKILIYHFMLFSDEKITLESPDQDTNQEFDEEVLHMRQLLKTRLVDMNLSVRALNCLKAADVDTLGDLVQFNKTDLLKFRNFGKKSLSELDDLLESLNLSFGTDISKYKLDKICHLDSKASMQIDLTINKGRGYVPADENRQFCTDVNVLPIDSIYTPIRNVKYAVEPYRVEQKTDYDKLVLEVTTDGSISPKDALKEAAKILIYHFMLFSDEKITLESPDQDTNQEFDEEVLHMRQLLKTRLVDMNLSVRALNCLKAADVDTLGDLVQFNKTDLLKFRNFGKKSLSELDDLLESLNLSFGTDISKYKLDKDA
jgi:DNA-directed RNA polymerase subunit alpha